MSSIVILVKDYRNYINLGYHILSNLYIWEGVSFVSQEGLSLIFIRIMFSILMLKIIVCQSSILGVIISFNLNNLKNPVSVYKNWDLENHLATCIFFLCTFQNKRRNNAMPYTVLLTELYKSLTSLSANQLTSLFSGVRHRESFKWPELDRW